MAEPAKSGTVSMRVGREFLASRLEVQLLAKVYDLLVPAPRNRCHLLLSSTHGIRSDRVSGVTPYSKGV